MYKIHISIYTHPPLCITTIIKRKNRHIWCFSMVNQWEEWLIITTCNVTFTILIIIDYRTMFMSVSVTENFSNIKLIISVLCYKFIGYESYIFCKSKYKFWPASSGAPSTEAWRWIPSSLAKKYNTLQSGWESLETRVTNDGRSDVSGCLHGEIFSRVVLNWV